MLHRAEYVKPDGRKLWLYGRGPLSRVERVPSPFADPLDHDSHLRWNPLAGEWVIYATHRQDRTFLPASENDPLSPSGDLARPTELPIGNYDVAVFENRFPSLSLHPAPPPALEGCDVAPAGGSCEVVVFTQDGSRGLGDLPLDHLCLVFEVWADRTRGMREAGLAYVLPFENRGTEMGVTLPHAHGQIYGYGILPQYQRRMAERLADYHARTGRDLVADVAIEEREREIRVVNAAPQAIAFAPPFGRFPYETWITPLRAVPDLSGLEASERHDMASMLKDVLRRLDALWQRPMPYLMTVNQAPTKNSALGWTVHLQIWPIRRARDKLKYLAGTELGTGVFTNDVAPEAAAAALRGLSV
jgi:UDPglucose--hexose-1-phosphate uridylyltransferase